MPSAPPASLIDEIQRLKKERDAVILAHNYQIGEVQDVADFVGDSLALSRQAARSPAKVIVFCGVHFMAETAAILCPDKTVLLPDLGAGCSLAATIDAVQLRAWKKAHPGAAVVAYVNSSAAVKAESDYCCTSSNAVQVVDSLPAGQEVHLWPGSCHGHYKMRDLDIEKARREHPGAEVVVHPECGCLSSALKHADHIVSTGGMLKRVKESPAKTFLVATETGILHTMKKENPGKTFLPVLETARCEFMKKITLENVLWSLERMQHRITVAPDVAAKARRAIDRMMEINP
jgi:quinolinate synthase